MQEYSNELHKQNKILIFDTDDLSILALLYISIIIASVKTLFITIPLFWYYKKIKKQNTRGFLKHSLYKVGLLKIEGYPTSSITNFYE